MQVNVQEAKAQLSRLLAAVERGEEVIIARRGRPIARLSALAVSPKGTRPLGWDAGCGSISPDFDDDLPDDMLSDFYGD